MKYGVWRVGGIDHREYPIYLPLKAELEKDGGALLFHEDRPGIGTYRDWKSSKNISIEKCSLDEMMKCDVLDFADLEIIQEMRDLENKPIKIIDIIPNNIKIIVNIHSPESLKRLDDKAKDKVSEFVLKWNMSIPSYFPLKKTFRINHAVYTDFWKPQENLRKTPKELFVLEYCGQIIYEKGFGELIDAYLRAKNFSSNIKLLLAGYDPSGAGNYYMKKYNDYIVYTGLSLWGDDIVDFLNNGDAFCQPNFTNQGGYNILEAMSCGLPILTIDNGFMEKDVIENGKNGYICKDWQEMSDKMIELNDAPQLAKQMGEYGRQKIINEYSCDAVLKSKLEELRRMGFKV